MEKMLVVLFDSESKAFEGLSALKKLDKNGDITLYANTVISSDADGKLKVGHTADNGGLGTATGLFVGSLLGILGGPVGLAIGAGTGTIAGLAFDIGHDYVNADFIDEVSSRLVKGKTALIVEIDETWTVPVDTKLGALDGIVFRRLRNEVEDEQLRRESEAIVAEYNEWKEEMKAGIDTDKTKMNQALSAVKKKAQITRHQIEQKLNAMNNELQMKVGKMELQMKNAGETRKARLQKRANALKEEYGMRKEKLRQALKLINEAFAPKKEINALAPESVA